MVLLYLCDAILQANTEGDLLTRTAYCLPFIVFVCSWFVVGARLILRRLTSVEISAGDGLFMW